MIQNLTDCDGKLNESFGKLALLMTDINMGNMKNMDVAHPQFKELRG